MIRTQDHVVNEIGVWQALQTLSPFEQLFILLEFWGGYSQTLLASLLGISRMRLWQLKRRAFEALREELF